MGYFIISVLAGYAVIVLLVYLFQGQMVYHPVSELPYTPSAIGVEFREVIFETSDGFTLHGWYLPHRKARATVIFFHGNAGNIAGRLETIGMLNKLHVNLLIFDYRGYGKSEGTPSEKGTYLDAEAAWDYVTGELEKNAGQVVLMGRSLGGTVAANLAARRDPAGVILESTMISAEELAVELYPWLPVRYLIRYGYETIDYVKQIQVPILIAHSREDDLVPFRHGQTLFEAAGEPKTFLEMEGAHAGGFIITGEKYTRALDRFLTEITN